MHSAGKTRPNIVLIYVDDVGWNHLSCYGHQLIETPNIDRLAADGMLFTDAYSPAAVCSPSRCSLLSGQYVPRHGHYLVNSQDEWLQSLESKRPWRVRLQPTRWVERLPLDRRTYGDCLQAAGYTTGFFGKWHIGELYDETVPDQHPTRRGFDEAVIHLMAGKYVKSPQERYFYPQFSLSPPTDVPEGTYHGDLLTDQGVEFIQKHADEPFFLMLSCFLVHAPLQAKEETIAEYLAKYPNVNRQHATYLAMHKHLDDSVGRIVACLDESGLSEDTLVIFTSDNGGYGNHEFGGNHFGGNYPLKGHKHMYMEGGIRVPMLVKWPGVVEAGRVCDEPVHQVDFFPTFAQLAEASVPDDQVLDGVSLAELFRTSGETTPDRENLFWHFPGYTHSRSGRSYSGYPWQRPCSIVRSGDFKLFHWLEDNSVELYNVNADIGELNNIANIMPEKTSELLAILNTWRVDNKIPMPGPRAPQTVNRK